MKRLGVLLAAGLFACAPLRQQPLGPGGETIAPHFVDGGFIASDGAELGLSRWLPQGAEPWAVLVALHGMNDYAGAFRLPAQWWAERGVGAYALDLRGFGRSPQRGVWPERALLLSDIREAVAAARRAHPGKPVLLLGLSMGAAAALRAETAGPTGADGLILVSPGVWGWSQMPLLYRLSLRIGAAVAPGAKLAPPKGVQRQVTPTDNLPFLIAMGRDPNLLFETRTDALLGLVNLMQDAFEDAPAAPDNTLLLLGGRDEIIPPAVAERFAARLPPEAQVLRYPEGYHLLLADLQAERVWADILRFLAQTETNQRSVNAD